MMNCVLVALSLLPGSVESKTADFEEIPYTSLDGSEWPTHTLRLHELEQRLNLLTPLEVAYVELNADGKGPLVFIHGLGSYLKFWRYQLDHFAKAGYRVIAIDLPGFGKSSKPRGYSYSIPDQARSVRALLYKLEIEKPILVGHSMGGQTGLVYALNYPQHIQSLALISPAGFEEFSRRDKAWFKRVFSTSLVLGADEAAIIESIRYNNFANWKDEYRWLIDERLAMRTSPEFEDYAFANVKAVHGLLETELTRQNLRRIKVPTLVAFGSYDRLIPNRFLHPGTTRSIMEPAYVKLPQGQLVELKGCGHTAQIDCHILVNKAISRFLHPK